MLEHMICHECPKLYNCYINTDHCARADKIEEMINKHMRKYHIAYELEMRIYDAVLDDDNTVE